MSPVNDGPFVYRLGRKIFILERGVRFPYGLQRLVNQFISRDGEAVTHQAHNLKNAGSIPAPVTMVLEMDAYASRTKLQGCWTRMSTYLKFRIVR